MDDIIKILVSAAFGFLLSLIAQFVGRRFELEKLRLEWDHQRTDKMNQQEFDQIGKIKDAVSSIVLRLQSNQELSPTIIKRKLTSLDRHATALVSNANIYSPIVRFKHRLNVAKSKRESFTGDSYSGSDSYNPLLDELLYYAHEAIDECDRRLFPSKKRHTAPLLRRLRMSLLRKNQHGKANCALQKVVHA